jgi:hypothetical protein
MHKIVEIYSFMTGVITRDKVPTFELMLFRMCRGNVFLRVVEIEEPVEDPFSVITIQLRNQLIYYNRILLFKI